VTKVSADRIEAREIERMVGFELPRSAPEYRAWRSNNPANSVMTKAWLLLPMRG
jgi:hypothetical protein